MSFVYYVENISRHRNNRATSGIESRDLMDDVMHGDAMLQRNAVIFDKIGFINRRCLYFLRQKGSQENYSIVLETIIHKSIIEEKREKGTEHKREVQGQVQGHHTT